MQIFKIPRIYFIDTIHEEDEIFHFLKSVGWDTNEKQYSSYLSGAFQTWEHIKNALEQFHQPIDQVESLLDFASGFGRNTRFMIRDIDPSKVTVSDLSPEMMRFQGETFGVNTIISNEDPAHFNPHQKFQLITCVSLFSHLPRELFKGWLRKLMQLLEPGGLMIFSTHPISLVNKLDPNSTSVPVSEYDKNNFVYIKSSETKRLNLDIYGATFVNPEFVKKSIEEINPNKKLIGFGGKNICHHQDLYVIGNKSLAYQDISENNYVLGFTDKCWIENGNVYINGWSVFGNEKKSADKLRIKSGGHFLDLKDVQLNLPSQDVIDFHSNPQLKNCRFSAKFNVSQLNEDKRFIVEASYKHIKNQMFNKFGVELSE